MSRNRTKASRRSGMQHHFSQVPSVSIQRSTFKRDHTHKTTFDSGWLVPFYVDEALPGDTFRCNSKLFARLTTPIVPVMDNMYLDTFYFAVPVRLVWDNFQKFMGEQENPDDSTDYLVPQVDIPTGALQVGTLWDYFGLPTIGHMEPNETLSVSALFPRAYNLIWNEWFRDENLQDSQLVPKDDGPDDALDYPILKRAKRHDYFTSALPWPQKGPGVELPLGDTAPVVSTGTGEPRFYAQGAGAFNLETGATDNSFVHGSVGPWGVSGANFQWFDPSLEVDLSAATAATINSLRMAFQMQRMLEKDARGGTRYTEIIRNHFRVVSPDARLQRPEYLGGNSTPINMQSVPQTSATPDQPTPQGNLAAFSQTFSDRNGFTKSFTEHTIIIGLLNVRADLTYQQGINRMWSRRTKYDFYWPSLAHLGEQAILNKEIYQSPTPGNVDDQTFGYQERWAEYRYKPSIITGKLRSTVPDSLDVWHLSQKFDNLPALNAQFIVENPPIDRVIAVPSEPQFLLDSFIQLRTARPMPTYSVPGLIDHF